MFKAIQREQLKKDKIFNFKGVEISYSIKGRGEPVILIHGSMISDPWKGFENILAEKNKIYLPHLPGFGASDIVKGETHNTELFAETLCAFIKELKLENIPVIAFSLGAVVAVKSARNGCLKGKLILVGLPTKTESKLLKKASIIPVHLRRIICSTEWGRDKILIPVLRDILGNKDKRRDNALLSELLATDTKSLVDLDVYKEIDLMIPNILPKLKNEITYIYGENDGLKNNVSEIIQDYIIINNADHNVFRSQPEILLKELRKILG